MYFFDDIAVSTPTNLAPIKLTQKSHFLKDKPQGIYTHLHSLKFFPSNLKVVFVVLLLKMSTFFLYIYCQVPCFAIMIECVQCMLQVGFS